MRREDFEDAVAEALDGLPKEVAGLMDNIGVTVADRPTREQARRAGVDDTQLLLGLYTGVPLGARGRHRYSNVPPDTVILFQRNIEAACRADELVATIRRVVLHEVGHHFGLSDDRLRELGY